jgi:hypothetical protein
VEFPSAATSVTTSSRPSTSAKPQEVG